MSLHRSLTTLASNARQSKWFEIRSASLFLSSRTFSIFLFRSAHLISAGVGVKIILNTAHEYFFNASHSRKRSSITGYA